MGGRGGSGGKITFAQAKELSKQRKSLNQRIGRLQSNIDIVDGKYRFIGITESGRKRLRSAQRTYESDKTKLSQLKKELDSVDRKLKRYQQGR